MPLSNLLALGLQVAVVSAALPDLGTFPITSLSLPGYPHLMERAGRLQAREDLSCYAAAASASAFEACLASVDSDLSANPCSTFTNTVSEVSCNCHVFTELYGCVVAACPNFATATITEEAFLTIRELAPTCTSLAAAGAFDEPTVAPTLEPSAPAPTPGSSVSKPISPSSSPSTKVNASTTAAPTKSPGPVTVSGAESFRVGSLGAAVVIAAGVFAAML